ncbi:MAG: polysaccharide biosynthesis/export family protein [Bacteroidota bacterium]|nr:polysaccharide biosynthesis/export family protein [Bacteroidota bacterium]
MKNKTHIVVLLLSLFLLSSCYNYKSLRLLQENNKKLPTYENSAYTNYRIQVNDEVIYRLITSDETISKIISPQASSSSSSQNQISYRVYPDSTIDLPFISHIPVAGLTLSEATKVVEKRFKDLIPDAVVKLSLSNKTFTIFGDAGSGIFPIYKEKLSIFQALSMSGDLNETSDRKHVRIIRDTDKGTQILDFDIRPKSIIDSKYYYIYPNDIIYVQRNYSSFYKVNSYTALLGVITFSLSLLFSVLNYTK